MRALIVGMTLVLAACSSDRDGASRSTSPDDPSPILEFAVIFSGPVGDNDYNQLGLLALETVEAGGISTGYTASVLVSEAEEVMRADVAAGATTVWTHGGQFYDTTAAVARDFPEVQFIAETEGEPEDQPDNVWIIDRQFHLGFYVLGVLASELTETGTVGYVGGLPLPFALSEVHAIEQAITDGGYDTVLQPVFTSDFNDADKARLITSRLIDGGADVVLGSLNDATVGTFEAAAAADGRVWVTAKYTDKSTLDPAEVYAGTLLYDFTGPLQEILARIDAGERTGYYRLGFDTGVTVELAPTVPENARRAVTDAVAGIVDGTVTVAVDTSPMR